MISRQSRCLSMRGNFKILEPRFIYAWARRESDTKSEPNLVPSGRGYHTWPAEINRTITHLLSTARWHLKQNLASASVLKSSAQTILWTQGGHTHTTYKRTMQHTEQMIHFYSTPQGVKSRLLPQQVHALAASESAESLCKIKL